MVRFTHRLSEACFRRRLRGTGEYAGLGLLFGGVLAGLGGLNWLWPVLACGVVFGVAGFRQGPTPPVTVRARPLLGADRRLR